MNAQIATRGRFSGVSEIVLFNWHSYVASGAAITIALISLALFQIPNWMRCLTLGGVLIAALCSLVSIAVSHWVYDCSPLREWRWVTSALSSRPLTWCNIHCGLDESSSRLRELFPEAEDVVLDIFDSKEMTEHSIARARRGRERDVPADFRRLPLTDAGSDAILLLFAAHELRAAPSRDALFNEVSRVLKTSGEVIVAEHLRDAANFCAFGPGAFHFFSRGEWMRVFAKAELEVAKEFAITPFVRVFVLRRTR